MGVRRAVLFAALLLSAVLQGTARAQGDDVRYDYDTIIVKPKSGAFASVLAGRQERAAGLSLKERTGFGAKVLKARKGEGRRRIEELKKSGLYEYVEPNMLFRMSASAPNDTYFSKQWGLRNTAYPGIDANALSAWDITRGRQDVAVAVLDSGVAWHPDELNPQLWVNPGEGPAPDGRDNDGNGLVDDINGWDWVNGKPIGHTSDSGHGTHVSGIIAARTDNGVGVAGLAPGVRLMELKVCGDSWCYLNYILQAIDYAIAKGAKVINASWGGCGGSYALKEAVSRFVASGGVFVAAAGNSGKNIDLPCFGNSIYQVPASYARDIPGVVAVSALNMQGRLSFWSNYGPDTVLLAAPGESIYSTYLGPGYTAASGTSMAAPHVSAAAALLFSAKPEATPAEVVQALRAGARKLSSLDGKVAAGGILDAYASLVALVGPPDTAPPGEVSDLSVSSLDGGLRIVWTDPQDEDYDHAVVEWRPADQADWSGSASVPRGAGGRDILGLSNGTEYVVRVSTVDARGNRSAGVEARGTPRASDATPPGEVSGLKAVPGDGSLSLSWTDPRDPDYVRAEACVRPAGGTWGGCASVSKGVQAHTFTGLANGVLHEARVKTIDAAGNASAGVTVSGTPGSGSSGDAAPPGEVVGPAVRPGSGWLVVSWIADPKDADFDHVLVCHGRTSPNEECANVAPGRLAHVITGLENGVRYTVRVAAADAAGNVSRGLFLFGTPQASDVFPPGDPRILGRESDASSITVRWADPPDPDFVRVRVGWSLNGSGPYSYAEVPKGTGSFTASGVRGTYRFVLQAVDASGNASRGAVVYASTKAVLPPPPDPNFDVSAHFGKNWYRFGDPNLAVLYLIVKDKKPRSVRAVARFERDGRIVEVDLRPNPRIRTSLHPGWSAAAFLPGFPWGQSLEVEFTFYDAQGNPVETRKAVAVGIQKR